MSRKQCKKCPWRNDVDPNDIPNGYCEQKHANLKSTIARPGELRLFPAIHVMACHESKVGAEIPCVGWLANQLGPGNNLALRLRVFTGSIDGNFELVGEQHETFEDTLSKAKHRPSCADGEVLPYDVNAGGVDCAGCGRHFTRGFNAHVTAARKRSRKESVK